jgi:hypothetical protein
VVDFEIEEEVVVGAAHFGSAEPSEALSQDGSQDQPTRRGNWFRRIFRRKSDENVCVVVDEPCSGRKPKFGWVGNWFGRFITRRARKEAAREAVYTMQGLDEDGEVDLEIDDTRWGISKEIKKAVAGVDAPNSAVRRRALKRWSKRAPELKRLTNDLKFENPNLTRSPADLAYLTVLAKKVVEESAKTSDVVKKYKAWFLKAVSIAYFIKSEDDELLTDVMKFIGEDPVFG